MEIVFLFFAIPLVGGLIARHFFNRLFTWQEYGILSVGVCIISAAVISFGYFEQVSDTEILNGQITAKHRDHGTYEEPYSCNCRTVTRGSGKDQYTTEECDTCYETHYTVKWYADSTIGYIGIDSADSTSRSVYLSQDPFEYTKCQVGEPASKDHAFVNYVKAVPTSLFNTKIAEQRYGDMVPSYPGIHSIYRINRVINVGSQINQATIDDLNNKLSDHLRVLGPNNQANIIAIFTGIKDPMYRHAVENSWLGGKKNDIVLFFGLDEAGKIVWNDVMTWALNSGNELFVTELKRRLAEKQEIDTAYIADTTANMVAQRFIRPKMKDYEYLKDDIHPSTNVMITCFILTLLLTIGGIIFFIRND